MSFITVRLVFVLMKRVWRVVLTNKFVKESPAHTYFCNSVCGIRVPYGDTWNMFSTVKHDVHIQRLIRCPHIKFYWWQKKFSHLSAIQDVGIKDDFQSHEAVLISRRMLVVLNRMAFISTANFFIFWYQYIKKCWLYDYLHICDQYNKAYSSSQK